jgi:hypothetical protein
MVRTTGLRRAVTGLPRPAGLAEAVALLEAVVSRQPGPAASGSGPDREVTEDRMVASARRWERVCG